MINGISSHNINGAMVELVDTSVLGTDTARCEGSSPFRPTNVDKSVYEVVYDMTTLSTIVKTKGVVYKELLLGSGLRNQYGNM
jgi:hypothetical protein